MEQPCNGVQASTVSLSLTRSLPSAPQNSASPLPAGLLRRLGAALYDGLLMLSLLFFATFPLLLLTRGQAIESSNWLYRAYLLLVAFAYFAWPWTHGGQTLGMRSWRIRVCRLDGGGITWLQALGRFTAALLSWLPLGAGFLWSLADADRRTWHDLLSKTRLEMVPPPQPRRRGLEDIDPAKR